MTSTARRTRLTLAIGASALLGALVLSGCTPEPGPAPTTSSPTPTPTLSTQPAPESEEEATAAAERAAAAFVDTLNSIMEDGGENAERIDEVATDPARNDVHTSATAVADNGYVIEGGNTFTVTTAFAAPLTAGEETIEFGSVTLIGCYDSSERTVTLPDGSAAPTPPNPATVTEFSVIYSPDEETWLVRSVIDTGEAC